MTRELTHLATKSIKPMTLEAISRYFTKLLVYYEANKGFDLPAVHISPEDFGTKGGK